MIQTFQLETRQSFLLLQKGVLHVDELVGEEMQEKAQERRTGSRGSIRLTNIVFCGQAHVAAEGSTIAVPHKYTIPVVKIWSTTQENTQPSVPSRPKQTIFHQMLELMSM